MTSDHPGDNFESKPPSPGQPRVMVLKLLDLAFYGLTVTAILLCASAAISFAVGAGWGGAKYLLFVIGFLLFGIGALGLRPKAAWGDNDTDHTFTLNDDETRFQSFIQAIPPLRWYELAPNDRFSFAAKLFIGSLFMLAMSFMMEVTFSITI